ncbi:MAG: hypothetical protein LH609_03750 [Rudanella sp.]|nr:hypothetical protein [Rudanella sp.]
MLFNREDANNTQREQKKNLRILRLLCLFVVPLLSHSAHEYHASVTNMQYNPKERVFEVSVRMFTDDLEKTLTRENGGQRVIFDKKYEKNNDHLLEKYIRKHFALQTAQKQRKAFNYVGHETEADAQWVYLELPYPEPFQGVNIQQSVLLDMFDDQVNLVTINYNSQKKTLLFRKNQTVQAISL